MATLKNKEGILDVRDLSSDNQLITWKMDEKLELKQSESIKLTCVLLGTTGGGKSSMGNTLLGKKRFEPVFGQNAAKIQSPESYKDEVTLEGMRKVELKIVDTPGFFDQPTPTEEMLNIREKRKEAEMLNSPNLKNLTELCQTVEDQWNANRLKELKNKIQQCMTYSGGAIYAFFFVMSCKDRFDPVSKNTLKLIAEMFNVGVHLKNYLFLAFTHSDLLENDDIEEDDYLKNYLHSDTKEMLYEVCGGRYVFVNNLLLKSAIKSGSTTLLDEERRKILNSVLQNVSKMNNLRLNSVPLAIMEMQYLRQNLCTEFNKITEVWLGLVEELDNAKAEYIKYGNTKRDIEVGSTIISLVAGLVLGVTGIVLAIPTAGLSVTLIASGAAVTAAGGGAALASGLILDHKKKTTMDEAERKIVEPFVKYIQTLIKADNHLLRVKLELWQAKIVNRYAANEETNSDKKFNFENFKFLPRLLSSTLQSGMVTALKLSDDFAKFAGVSASAVPIVGVVIGALTDMFNFALAVYKRGTNKDKADRLFEEMNKKCQESFPQIRQLQQNVTDDIEYFCKNTEEACTCIICHYLWVDPIVCPQSMKHICCRNCVREWHKTSATCPICRCEWKLPSEETNN